MPEITIRAEALSKQYEIGASAAGYGSFRETISDFGFRISDFGRGIWERTTRHPSQIRNPKSEIRNPTIWALNDVSFEVQRGDVIGVIGRNGAGKSTLLKILSRITEPTSGTAEIHGRVASLLEVGTGFHPDLTGRENLYLNGSILGMSRSEIRRKFDEIVAFAGVETFVDTPVKRYSTGMGLRLAFAVAAHLEAEIMLVDEVLAVGDVEFQRRCLGKMKDVATSGRTVLFVSHNMQAITLLCNKAMLFSGGRLAYSGSPQVAVREYLADVAGERSRPEDRCVDSRPGSGQYRFTSVVPTEPVYGCGEEKQIEFCIERRKVDVGSAYLSALLVNEQGHIITQLDSRFVNIWIAGEHRVRGTLTLRSPWLKAGNYRVDMYICALDAEPIIDKYENACLLTVSVEPYPNSAPPDATLQAAVLADFDWSLSGRLLRSWGGAAATDAV